MKLAIDDFGIGYSSLNYLSRFPVDTLKIDRAFVTSPGANSGDIAIVQAIATLAQSLGLSITAEGVESGEVLELLRSLGCTHGQGYYFAKPQPAEAAANIVAHASFRVGMHTAQRPGPSGTPSASTSHSDMKVAATSPR